MFHQSIAVASAEPWEGSRPRAWWRRPLSDGWLVGALVLWLGFDAVLLLPFLGIAQPLALAASMTTVAVLAAAAWRLTRDFDGPTPVALAGCAAVALAVYLLGGEGRLFYANTDWRVRDGVLHDMAVNAWPYAYTARGLPELLRAPVGMYLLPALAMKAAGQRAGDLALLLQNSALLTIVLGLGASLFATARRRVTALVVIVFFSGLDIVGALLSATAQHQPVPDHLEWWSGTQYSSHVTQAFWVPQHALAGWIGAVAFLLWRERKLPLAVFLALVPLALLWSPLSTLGVLPFAAYAGVATLWRRELRAADVALPALATALMVPTLLYLSAAGQSVGSHAATLPLVGYLAFVLLEAVPFLLIAASATARARFGVVLPLLLAAVLLALPFWQVGWSQDFTTRASIPTLAIAAVIVAHVLTVEPRRERRWQIVLLLALGSVTGLHEIARAVRWPAAPVPLCTFYGAWGPSPASDKSTYLAPVASLPHLIRPAAVHLVPNRDPARCWAGPWPKPTGI